ncbi:VOC family protein [Aestuariibius sp. HNIBRBA575]|uniref:VOC family protein n=1 Tax=Aestuariibius sp. HNIBRBA575 TaxID=3233343 RepID=UPI0034A5B77F
MILDHLAVVCSDLDAGTDYVEQQLGVVLQPGGKHARFGTHNRLLGLGGDLYLEVIAIDPSAQIEGPHWFDLDHFDGPPRLGNWICAVSDLAAAVHDFPFVGGKIALQRDALRWQMAVPPNGSLPFDGAFPTLIEWGETTPHPAGALNEQGVRLSGFEVHHPQSMRIAKMLPAISDKVRFIEADQARFCAHFDTPNGPKVLR